ncbi:MAG TPA: response regulator transcription factor [Chloroflexota bacterium]
MRVLVADDDVHVRSALRLLLEQEPDVQVVGESMAADELVGEIGRTHPAVVLLDWELPGLRSNGLLTRLRLTTPGLRTIAMSGRPEQRVDALRAGVDAFVCKGDAPETLLGAVRALAAAAAAYKQPDHQPVGDVSGPESLEVV